MNHRQCSLLLCMFLASCASFKPMSMDTRAVASLPQYWLTTSMYAGPFYESLGQTLLDYRPFSLIDDLRSDHGSIIRPPAFSHIVPAGTLVQITKVVWPGSKEAQKRPLLSPKDHIWLYLKVAKERGQVSVFFEDEHILVVPKNISTKDQLKTFINSVLAKSDPHRWILGRQSYIQNGIWLKKPQIGMNERDLKATLGTPLKKQQQKNESDESISEIWHYPHYFIVLKENRVIKIKNLMVALK